MNWREVPIFITNFNNLDRGFRHLLAWLRAVGQENITVIDNGSTWAPLLKFYDKMPELMVIRLPENKGPYALWQLDAKLREVPFIVTDPDLVPQLSCPRDLVARMLQAMEVLPACPCKVGPSLRVDNIPAHYRHRGEVVLWEAQFWNTLVPVDGWGAYQALIDTTFALYKAGSPVWPPHGTHYRLAPPYTVEHVPWYEDTERPSEERLFYKQHAYKEYIHW